MAKTEDELRQNWREYCQALGWDEEDAPTLFEEFKALVEEGEKQRNAVRRLKLIQEVIDNGEDSFYIVMDIISILEGKFDE